MSIQYTEPGFEITTLTLTYFGRGSITVQPTSCLTSLDLAEQVNLLLITK